MLRVIHTSDWHLGQTLHGFSREHEHARFLHWLEELLVERESNALLIAGDIFDSANPPTAAMKMLYEFVARVYHRLPKCRIVMIGGNHDSSARLDAPRALLEAMNVAVVGGLRRLPDGAVDYDKMIVPLPNSQNEVEGWCLAIPFLRPFDFPVGITIGPLFEGYLAAAVAKKTAGQALIALSHCYVAGAQVSEMSEKKVVVGNQEALPHTLFSKTLAYTALGHLHLAQTVGRRENLGYSGSPIPLALSEDDYPHQVVSMQFVEGVCRNISPEPIPRTLKFVRVPAEGAVPPKELYPQLKTLGALPFLPLNEQPLLEARVLLEEPQPTLRAEIERVLQNCPVRLARIALEYNKPQPGAAGSGALLQETTPEEVFRECYRRSYFREPPADLLNAFHELERLVLSREWS